MTRRWDDGVRWHYEEVDPPADQPLALAFVRDQHLRVTNGTAEDDYITQLLKVSTVMAEKRTNRAHYPRVGAMVMDRFPVCDIDVTRSPLIAVSSITYFDANGVQQTLASDRYQVVGSRSVNRPYVIAPEPDETWPETEAGRLNAVTVTYRHGYGDGASPETIDIPESILQGQLLVIGELYKQRSTSVIGFGVSVTPAVLQALALWDQHRIY